MQWKIPKYTIKYRPTVRILFLYRYMIRGVTIRYPHDTIRIAILSHDTIRIAIPGENRKMNQLITIGSLYCILCVCSFDLSRQHLAFALLLFNSMNTLYIIV